MKDCALVLEGGALRGVFTSGALDVLMEQDLYLPYVIGVSAGSLNAFGYLSRQIGRSGRSNIEYARDPRYLGLKNLVQKRSIFNFDFMFGELSHDLLPFDYDAFFASPIRFVAVATDCETGRPFYYEKKPGRDETIFDAAVASSSMPLFAPPKKLLGRDYLDGGVAMPIAFEKVMITADRIAGITSGNVIFVSILALLAPRISPISSSSELMELRAEDTSR